MVFHPKASQSFPGSTIFFPGLFFYVYIERPNPKNHEGPTPQAQNPINKKPQTQYKTPTPNPQTTINEPK